MLSHIGGSLPSSGPRIESAELKLNLDFILDNSDDEVQDESSDVVTHEGLTPEHEAILQKLDADLEAELKLNLDFIGEIQYKILESVLQIYRKVNSV